MIKAVLFDFGGVLTEGGKGGSIKTTFAAAYGCDPASVQLDRSIAAGFRGIISDEEMVAAINRLNASCPPARTTIFSANDEFFARCEAVYALADRLRKHDIVTAIFSNVFKVSADQLQKDGFYEGFAPLFLSYKYGMQKPERLFYERAIQELRVSAAEILFIDDKDDFLAPARDLGMRTVLAVSPQQIVDDVIALIAKENGIRLGA